MTPSSSPVQSMLGIIVFTRFMATLPIEAIDSVFLGVKDEVLTHVLLFVFPLRRL